MQKPFSVAPVKGSDLFQVVHPLPNGRVFAIRGTKASCEELVSDLAKATSKAFAEFVQANRKHGHGHHGHGKP